MRKGMLCCFLFFSMITFGIAGESCSHAITIRVAMLNRISVADQANPQLQWQTDQAMKKITVSEAENFETNGAQVQSESSLPGYSSGTMPISDLSQKLFQTASTNNGAITTPVISGTLQETQVDHGLRTLVCTMTDI